MAEIYEVTKAYRDKRRLSLRGFAEEINHGLTNTSVTYQTVARWEQEIGFYEPDMRLLFECLATYTDWRAKWAQDCLQAMFPDLFMSGVVRVQLPIAE